MKKKWILRIVQLVVLIVILVFIRVLHSTQTGQEEHLKTHNTGVIEHVYGEEIQIRSDTSDLVCNIFKDGKQAGYVLY
ncbi:MAG: hypothetical protein ACP5DZ_09450, partial [Bacteroidales bacterium]